MATKKLTINSFITFHPHYAGDNCGFCATRNNLKFAIQFDYDSSCIIEWREDNDFDDHGEVYVCWGCADRFDPDVLLEA